MSELETKAKASYRGSHYEETRRKPYTEPIIKAHDHGPKGIATEDDYHYRGLKGYKPQFTDFKSPVSRDIRKEILEKTNISVDHGLGERFSFVSPPTKAATTRRRVTKETIVESFGNPATRSVQESDYLRKEKHRTRGYSGDMTNESRISGLETKRSRVYSPKPEDLDRQELYEPIRTSIVISQKKREELRSPDELRYSAYLHDVKAQKQRDSLQNQRYENDRFIVIRS